MKIKDLTTGALLRVLSAAAGALVLSTGAALAADYPTTVLADNPSAYYRFEETNGSPAMDSSTNGVPASIVQNGENSSPVLGAPGLDSNCFNFIAPGPGGESDFGYVDIPYSSYVSPLDGTNAGAFSAELWVKPNSYPQNWEVPILQGANNGGSTVDGWNVYVSGPGAGNPAGQSYFYLDIRPGIFQGYGDFLITFGAWYHLVLTYDGANAVFYINGVAHTNAVGAGAFVPDTTEDALIGSGAPIGWLPFNGSIDEVAFYDHVLTAAQVANHYAVGTNSINTNVTFGASIISEPTGETNYSGLPVTFSVGASGTLPLTYTWSTNGVVTGTDSSSLTFTAQYPGNNNANVQVVVSNSFGPAVTSSVVNLTVLTNLNILANPSSSVRNVGSHAAFHVTANGAVPITYQWAVSSDGGSTFTPISAASNPTATNQTFWLSNVQLAQSGNEYQVTVSNPFGSATAIAGLTVQTRQDPPVPLEGYGAIIAADNPVAYWRLDETNGTLAEDAVGTFDGAYTPGAGTITYGVPSGVPHSADPAVTLANGATIQVPWAPELNPDTAWSVETWVNPSSLAANGGDYRVVLSSEYNSYPFAYNGWYIYQQPSETFAFVPQPANAFIVGGPNDPATTNQIVAGNWYHLVVTDDTTNFYMYINGQLATSYPAAGLLIPDGDGINSDGNAGLPNGNDAGDDGGNFVIGQRTDGAFNTFEGSVDDTAVYQYALSPQQVKSHYLVGAILTITPSGSNVILTWPVGTLQQAGSITGTFTDVTATSPYTTAAGGAAKYYRVVVR